MNRQYGFLSFLAVIGLIYLSFYTLMPREGTPASIPETEFSTERALLHLREISREPHMNGSPANDRVKDYLVEQLKELGLDPQIQEGFVINQNRGVLDKPVNILAKIDGTIGDRTLMIFSHYDSALVPSYGASDAGSGVVTILESVRAFLNAGVPPKNDIIILFTDAEEIGLDGAQLFVDEHPWAQEVDLALNFEARGSGGPSNMIVETNHGNQGLIKAFKEAGTEYPVASSLMYSIYKMLPNDTDSTVLREGADIDGYFFAFIDDHFDYHTANDNFENLDRNTLQHQGSYLLPLLTHLAQADLNVRASEDDVYVNFPFIKMINYPFSWILPMWVITVVLLLVLVGWGMKKGKLSGRGIGRGSLVLLLALILCTVIGKYGWSLIMSIYPEYYEIQHGFTYNGHTYIIFFVLLSLGITLFLYRRLAKQVSVANLSVAPLILWIIINGAVYLYLKGAAYFVIPVFFGLAALWLMIWQETPNLLLMALLIAPALILFSPLIQFFPVGLGLEMLLASCAFTVLLFGLALPVIGYWKGKKFLTYSVLLLSMVFLIRSHLQSDFTPEQQKPNSLIYYQDQDKGESYWVSYDDVLDSWTESYLGEEPKPASDYVASASGSKYNTGYSFANRAPDVLMDFFDVQLNEDTLIGNDRSVRFTVHPREDARLIRLYADTLVTFKKLVYNGKSIEADSTGYVWPNRRSNFILQYYVPHGDSLEVAYTSADQSIPFTILEYSFDLMSNDRLNMNPRPENTMPKPFVTTDAVVVRRSFDPRLFNTIPTDSLIADD
ncbi:M20/M25/M40 family metallo-hydrolase [Aureitalea marina]|uniref:Vacuolar membrane protease n=1 Tax=Aureitalea marina TaxID=930804 RepID=A0A2S7KSJ0_9FLAO|nr:M20/M25/M40 family metallo-hydrolase [Aureitalea marina]PQB05595.1 peptidase M28 [Aureitalea marina]